VPARAARRGRPGAAAGNSLAGKAKAIVLKFIARTTAGVAMKYLERNVRKGLIVMDGDDPAAWRRISHIDDLGLSGKATLRILLWVHGTFSSTAGSFGALAATPDGRYLLKQARERYDAVIGFDHATLAETPYENAVDLVERLGRFEAPMQIDAITYSRGGLVFRSLLEQILPPSAARPEVGQVVFVGVPNHGTLLADPERWRALADVYTNLSMGAFALLRRLPAVSPTAYILAESISGLGAFVKYLAEVIVADAVVPGLAAQAPGGPFLRALNETGPEQPLPDTCRYLAVTSNFDPSAAVKPGAAPTGLAASFLGKLADGLVDRLMAEVSDLVVNTSSMKRIDPEAGNFIDASLDFGDSPAVYHTVYFAQGGVAQQLRGWLMDDDAREGFIERRGLLTVRPSPRSPFSRIRFLEGEGRRAAGEARLARGAERTGRAARTAAAAHLKKLFGVRKATEPMRGAGIRRTAAAGGARAAAPRARAYAPALKAQSVQSSRITSDRHIDVVSFQQLHRSIPIFGSRATVEIGDAEHLVAARAKLGRVERVSQKAGLSRTAALRKLLEGVAPLKRDEVSELTAQVRKTPPPLTFFHDRAKNTWHLAYVFSDVPSVPVAWTRRKRQARHGCATSPRERFPRLDYLVDAHDGSIVYYYSVSPTMAKRRPAPPQMSINGRGIDEDGAEQQILVREVKGGFELHDPVRKIRTFDFGNGNIDEDKPPRIPIRVADATANFAAASTSGISAHLNVTRVFQFYNDVLIRRGVDDRGSYLDNMVNCVSPEDEAPPQWGNAIWWKNKMWYGQISLKKGKMRSLAASLDIIGHELTHGVTEHTCDLVYRDEAGALNESFSDIFGVLINNRTKGPAIYANPDKWDWEVGAGLGDGGKPLRNMKKPAVTDDPDHTDQMKDFDPADLEEDFGGVHTFSNIHNKAAYNLLTTRTGKRGSKTPLVFTPDQVAQLYYFTLQRLDRVATFEDVFETMSDVVKTVYRIPAERAAKLQAMTDAYAAVGIPRK
jgi:bacillolysin